MRVRVSVLNKFLGRYKRLKIVSQLNDKTGNTDWVAYNYQGRKVMNFSGRKSSILLLNQIYTVQQEDCHWVEEALKAAKEGVSV